MNWGNVNSVFRHVADEQQIEVGSLDWDRGGNAAWASSTGSQNSYGWRHDHKIDAWGLQYVKGVIANYGHRGIYYNDAPLRQSGYGIAMRPVGYVPELPGDQADGQVAYLTTKGVVSVSGPDILHLHLEPLFAIYDSQGHQVMAQGKLWPANVLAGVMIKYFMKALAGILMKTTTAINPYIPGDRGCSDIMAAVVGAGKRGLIDTDDLTKISTYVSTYMIPFFSKAPGFSFNIKDPQEAGANEVQTYNGLWWLLPAFYDALQIAPEGSQKVALTEIVHRWSQYMLDIEDLFPDQGTMVSFVDFPQGALNTPDGKPVQSWFGLISKEHCYLGKTDESPWGFRAQNIAAKVLNSDVMQKANDKVLAKWKAKGITTEQKVWFVLADGSYAG